MSHLRISRKNVQSSVSKSELKRIATSDLLWYRCHKKGKAFYFKYIQKIATIWRENMLGYLYTDIICSEKRTVFRERSSRKIVSFEDQMILLSLKSFSQRVQFWKLGNILGYSPVFSAWEYSIDYKIIYA